MSLNYKTILILLFLLPSFASAQEVDEKWLRILHMTGGKSLFETKSFFLAKDGRSNPEAELTATIKAFEETPEKQCNYPSRSLYLQKKGYIFRKIPCPKFEEFKEAIDADSVTLIFTDAYMNNPASLFGHTLLRLDNRKAFKDNVHLLSHTVNYGAFTGTDGGFFFAIKGLFGFYNGHLSVVPYHETVNLYNNMENRDLWEYKLNFTKEETDFLIAHIYEIGHAYAPYYFFTENCSFMMTQLLEVIRPETKLSEGYLLGAVPPTDTVRKIVKAGFVEKVSYRPSKMTTIRKHDRELSKKEKKSFEKESYANLSDREKARVIELQYDYNQYLYLSSDDISLTDMRKRSMELLKERKTVKEETKELFSPILKPAVSPDEGHKTQSVGIKAGHQNEMGTFVDVVVRLAVHDLLDNTEGYVDGSEINFMKAVFRTYTDRKKFELKQLDFATIRSLAPRDDLFKPISFNTGLRLIDGKMEGYIGPGVTYGAGPLKVYGFLNAVATNHIGNSVQIGIRYADDNVRVMAETEARGYYDEWEKSFLKTTLAADISLTRDFSFRLESSYQKYKMGREEWEASGGIKWSFGF